MLPDLDARHDTAGWRKTKQQHFSRISCFLAATQLDRTK